MDISAIFIIILGSIILIRYFNNPFHKNVTWGWLLFGIGVGILISIIYFKWDLIIPTTQNTYLENLLAISMAIIAVVTIIFTNYQLKELREHNRKSVFTKIGFHFDFFESSKKVGLFIDNIGLGPAIIKDIYIFYHKEEISGNTNTERFLTFAGIIQNISRDIKVSILNYDCAIKIESELLLIGIDQEGIPINQKGRHINQKGISFTNILILKKLLDQTEIIVNYENIYGERDTKVFTVHSQNP